jgi:hypothetical protein
MVKTNRFDAFRFSFIQVERQLKKNLGANSSAKLLRLIHGGKIILCGDATLGRRHEPI